MILLTLILFVILLLIFIFVCKSKIQNIPLANVEDDIVWPAKMPQSENTALTSALTPAAENTPTDSDPAAATITEIWYILTISQLNFDSFTVSELKPPPNIIIIHFGKTDRPA